MGTIPASLPCAHGQDLSPSASSEPPGDQSGRWVPSLRTLGRDAVDVVRAPFELSQSQKLLTLGASGVVVSAMATLDRPTHTHLARRSGAPSDVTFPLAAPGRWYDRAGPDRVILGTAGLLAASGVALQDRKWTRTSVRVLEAALYTKLATGLAKSTFNRMRPRPADGPFHADPGRFSSEHARLSMPSGHTARAFAVASVLAHQAERWYVSVPVYGTAASVALERVRSGDHWLTDVAVGGALGYFIGRSVTTSPDRDDVSYTPILGTDRIGVSVRF